MSRSPHRTPAADASFDASAGGSADWLPPPPSAVRGRGAAENPTNRFERLEYVPEPDEGHEGDSPGSAEGPATVYLRDPTRTALATNQSPDVGFDTSLNPYRGCEHGCIYCLAPHLLRQASPSTCHRRQCATTRRHPQCATTRRHP